MTAMIKSRIAHATLKSDTVIPKSSNTDCPATRKPMPTRKPVPMDWLPTFFRSIRVISEVRETKIGRIPNGSKATKSGTNGRKILSEMKFLKISSSQAIRIEYQRQLLRTSKGNCANEADHKCHFLLTSREFTLFT